MNENEIKDLTNIIKNHCDNTPDEDCVGIGCDECEARALINAGYRRVGEDEIVIKFDDLVKRDEKTKNYAERHARKVTAREILQELRVKFRKQEERFANETKRFEEKLPNLKYESDIPIVKSQADKASGQATMAEKAQYYIEELANELGIELED